MPAAEAQPGAPPAARNKGRVGHGGWSPRYRRRYPGWASGFASGILQYPGGASVYPGLVCPTIANEAVGGLTPTVG